MSTPEEIKAEYTSSLADLTFNSKPLINVLTMLAEENLRNAKIIVEAIEEHLAKVATDVKLPILYLIDCIVKNVGQTYTGLFSQNIVSTFCTVFKMVDEKTRLEMFKLRQTWNDVFPQMKLYAIDVQIHQIDPAWPVTAQPSNSIHLNPKFLKNTPTTTKAKIPTTTTDTAAPVAPVIPPKPAGADIDKETLLMQEQLIQKQKELLELQRKTLELEVLQTQVKLQEQMKSGGVPPVSNNILLKPEVAKQLIPEAMAKTRPTGIANSLGQRLLNNQPKINPVNPALAAARPIRDPRLLRQQQQQDQQEKLQKLQQVRQRQQQLHQQKAAVVNTTSTVPAQNTAVLETNKIVTIKPSVRDIPKDPRLSSKIDKKSKGSPKSVGPIEPKVMRSIVENRSGVSSPSFNSSSSSSLGSTSSNTNLDSPSKSRRKHKKRDKPDSKRSQECDSSAKREKVSSSPKEEPVKYNDSNKNDGSSFKSVKHKNRNYVRRNLADSPVQLQDEDLRSIPNQQENVSSIPIPEMVSKPEQKAAEPSVPTNSVIPQSKPMDVDLRQLPPSLPKKRVSSEASDHPSKKSRSFDVLFGSEDTDLRQLNVQGDLECKVTPPVVDRAPTPPPPPIISVEKSTEKPETPEKPITQSPTKSDFDAVRAKLANATSRDKGLNKSLHKNKLHQGVLADQDLRPKASPNITISPEEEQVIKSGQMTGEQQQKILNKIFMQIEKDKLREAKIKDKEDILADLSLQAISDDELDLDFENDKKKLVNVRSVAPIPPPPMPFNDKDERLTMHPHMQPIPHVMSHQQNMETVPMEGAQQQNYQPPFYGRGDGRRPLFRGARDNWRGRGRGSLQGPQARQPIRPWMHQQQSVPQPRWRGPGPHGGAQFAPRPEFIPMEDDASRSPIQDFGPQEITVIQDENKTLNIDGIPRDIRIYKETAIIFMNYDDPREISFQEGMRRVIFNNQENYILAFGDDYKDCVINGLTFRVKLGVPSREIFINELGFECFFGGPPIHLTISGVSMIVALEGPAPQVKVSDEKRTDLVVGKINMIINAKLMIPVFLDGKAQKFVIDGDACTLKFIDALKRVVINDVPFAVEFGGLPKPFIIHGKKHFIRFSVLPKGVKPGFVKIVDMEGESGASPLRQDENSEDGLGGPLEMEPLRPQMVMQSAGQQSPDNRSNSPGFLNSMLQPSLNNLDVISNVFSQTLTPAPNAGSYQVELPGSTPTTAPQGSGVAPPATLAAKPALNINELFQKLVASGFVKTLEAKNDPSDSQPAPSVLASTEVPVSNGEGPQQPIKVRPPPSEPLTKPIKRSLFDILKPVTFARPESLKVRQAPLYSTLYAGMQCSSCGMRFPAEASMWYSQHLDWHFRQNRRGKKNARVANSRKWYYALADWKNYEELEDLEEREKNYFDQQMQQAEVAEDTEEEAEIPTVPADPGTTNERCCMCRDTFEQFFNEEKEEWHLRNAIKVDDKTYHPVCYEDHQKSILEVTLDDSNAQEEAQNKLIPGLEIILDDDDDEEDAPLLSPNDVVSLADDDDDPTIPEDAPSPPKDDGLPEDDDDGDDDDVILNEVAPIKIVVDDDDDEEITDAQSQGSGSIVVKKEKQPVFDDGFMDVGEIVTLKEVGQVKIKSEPVDDNETHHANMDTSVNSETATEPVTVDLETQPVTSQPQPMTSHPELITSIDGNIELVSANASVPTSLSAGTKIKINISKPLPVITQKENSESSDNISEVVKTSEVAVEELEILSYKPALQNVPLKKLPPTNRGTELTGLCSIM